MAKTRRVTRRGPYKMTAKRKTALRKAQLVSAKNRSRAAGMPTTKSRGTKAKVSSVKIGGRSTKSRNIKIGVGVAGGVLGATGAAYVAHKGYQRYGGTIVDIRGYHDTYGKTLNGIPRSPKVGIRHDRTMKTNTGMLKRGIPTTENRHHVTVRPPTIGGYTIKHPSGGWDLAITVRSPKKNRMLRNQAIEQAKAKALRNPTTRTRTVGKVDKHKIAPYNPFAKTGWRSTATAKQEEKALRATMRKAGMKKKDAKKAAAARMGKRERKSEFPSHIPVKGRRHPVIKVYS